MTSEEEALVKEIEMPTRLIAENDDAHRKLFLAMIAVFGAFAGVYTSDGIIKSPIARTWALIALSQLVFMVLSRFVMEFALQSLHVGLKRALEARANTVLRSNVFLWESHVAKNRILGLRSAMSLSSGLLWLMALGGYIAVGYLASAQFESNWFLWVVATELGLLLLLGGLSVRDVAVVERSCASLLASSFDRPFSKAANSDADGQDCQQSLRGDA